MTKKEKIAELINIGNDAQDSLSLAIHTICCCLLVSKYIDDITIFLEEDKERKSDDFVFCLGSKKITITSYYFRPIIMNIMKKVKKIRKRNMNIHYTPLIHTHINLYRRLLKITTEKEIIESLWNLNNGNGTLQTLAFDRSWCTALLELRKKNYANI